MKLAFKYSLVILTIAFAALSVFGVYAILYVLKSYNWFLLYHTLFVLLSIPGFIYHLKTLHFYGSKKKWPDISNAKNLDEEFIFQRTSPYEKRHTLWFSPIVLALQTIFYSIYILIRNIDLIKASELGSKQFMWFIFLALVLYMVIGNLIDFRVVGKKIRAFKAQQTPGHL